MEYKFAWFLPNDFLNLVVYELFNIKNILCIGNNICNWF